MNETEVESVIEALKLTQMTLTDFEDYDSDEESDSELVW